LSRFLCGVVIDLRSPRQRRQQGEAGHGSPEAHDTRTAATRPFAGPVFPAASPGVVAFSSRISPWGAALPSAMMAAMLLPERRVLEVCGDGGFMMNSQEMETAVRLKLNLVILILEDSAYGMIRWKQAVDHFRGVHLVSIPID
jgi:thiamine pyrophosphate-dependent acetolactate synthase large subunit-like protein